MDAEERSVVKASKGPSPAPSSVGPTIVNGDCRGWHVGSGGLAPTQDVGAALHSGREPYSPGHPPDQPNAHGLPSGQGRVSSMQDAERPSDSSPGCSRPAAATGLLQALWAGPGASASPERVGAPHHRHPSSAGR